MASSLITSVRSKANLSIGKIHQTATRDGIKEWILDAESAQYIDAEKQANLQKLSVIFFLKDKSEIYLTADKGVLKTDTNNIEVTGNVVVKHAGYKMKTEKLRYKHKERVIFSKKQVKIDGDSFNLVADSMFFDLNTNRVLLEGRVKSVFSKNFVL
ncbi:MAG: LPS export ABC transporter periplasmic protein LptC [Deltaproteobacteria bacterium]|nr:LPS export ABC transporter periplasmic protein LptC [Deltaproteobacteria bacterium]